METILLVVMSICLFGYLICYIGQYKITMKVRKENIKLKAEIKELKYKKEQIPTQRLVLEACYIIGGDCSVVYKNGLSGFALLDLEAYQELLLDVDEEECAVFIQPIIDKAKVLALCNLG